MFGQTCRSMLLLSGCMFVLPGCMHVFNSVPSPLPDSVRACADIPAISRQNVCVIMVNGADPLCCGNLSGVRDHLKELGFVRTYFAQFYHESCLWRELRDSHACNPNLKFVIVGFEYGAGPARSLAMRASDAGIPIDLLVLIEPKGLRNIAVNPVDFTRHRNVTITCARHSLDQSDLDNSEIITVPCMSRYGVPTHPTTLDLLAGELKTLAMAVPIVEPVVVPFPSMLDDPAPPPRPVTKKNDDAGSDEWDFLKPVSRKKSSVETVLPPPIVEPGEPLPAGSVGAISDAKIRASD